MESKQTFKGDQFASSGHTYAKTKFSFDGSNKMNNEKPRFKGAVKAGSDTKETLKSSLGSPFKNPFSKFILPAVSNERAPTSLNGYVPTGLSEAEYKAAKSAGEAKKAQNKQRFPKGKQTLKGDQFASSGHTYAKTKFSFDGSNKMNNEKPRFKGAVKAGSDTKKSSPGSPFKNPFSKFVLPAVSNVKHSPSAPEMGANSFSIIDDKPSFQPKQTVQKLLTNDSSNSTALSAISIGLLSLVTMLGVYLRRGGFGSVMPMNTAS